MLKKIFDTLKYTLTHPIEAARKAYDYVTASHSRMAGLFYAVSDTGNLISGLISPLNSVKKNGNPFKLWEGILGYLSSASFLLSDRQDEDAIVQKLDDFLKNERTNPQTENVFEKLYTLAREEESKLGFFDRYGEKKAVVFGGLFQAAAAVLNTLSGMKRDTMDWGEIGNGIANIIGFGGLGNANVEVQTEAGEGGASRGKGFVIDNWNKMTSLAAGSATFWGLKGAYDQYKRGQGRVEQGDTEVGEKEKLSGATNVGAKMVSFGGDYHIWKLKAQEDQRVKEGADLFTRVATLLETRIEGQSIEVKQLATHATAEFIAAQKGIQQSSDEIAKRLTQRLGDASLTGVNGQEHMASDKIIHLQQEQQELIA